MCCQKFCKIHRKHLCWGLFFKIKLQASLNLAQVFCSCEFCKISNNTFFQMTHLSNCFSSYLGIGKKKFTWYWCWWDGSAGLSTLMISSSHFPKFLFGFIVIRITLLVIQMVLQDFLRFLFLFLFYIAIFIFYS